MKHIKLLSMDLQRFADDVDNPDVDETSEVVEKQEKTFTRSEMAKMMSAEIGKQKAEWLKEHEAKIEEERNEAARLAKLSEEERQQAIIDKEKADFEAEKAEFRKEQLLVEKGKQLLNEGLPSDFANRVLGETAEEASADIKVLKKAWDAAIEKAVNERLKHSAEIPGAGSNQPGDNNPWSKASFNLTRQGEILREDPERAKLLQQTAIK